MKLLVLDIDLTLIFSNFIENKGQIVGDFEFFEFDENFIIKRPYLDEFFEFVFKNFKVAFSTTMSDERCDFVFKNIFKEINTKGLTIRNRKDCLIIPPTPYSFEEIRKKSFDCDCIWLDDNPNVINLNKKFNQTIIKADVWDGDICDNFLLKVIDNLKLELDSKKN